MAKYKISTLFGLILMLSSFYAAAQSAQTFPLGPFQLTPSLEVDITKDDNLYLTESNKIDTTITRVIPSLGAVYDNGVSGVSLEYVVEDADYASRSTENYTDQSMSVSAGMFINDFHRIDVSASRFQSHNTRGQDSPSGAPVDPNNVTTDLDEYDDDVIGFNYEGQIIDSLFTVRLGLTQRQQRYTTNRVTTADFDLDEDSTEATILWNVAQGLQLGLSNSESEVGYLSNSSDAIARNAEQTVNSVQLIYEPSGVLSFTGSIGETERTQVSNNSKSTDDFWDVDLTWSFLSYSTLSMYTSNTFQQSASSVGDFTISESAGVSWSHQWVDNFGTEIALEDVKTNYSNDTREDSDTSVSLRLDYQFRRWLSVGAFARKESRSSNEPGVEEFDHDVYGINFTMSL